MNTKKDTRVLSGLLIYASLLFSTVAVVLSCVSLFQPNVIESKDDQYEKIVVELDQLMAPYYEKYEINHNDAPKTISDIVAPLLKDVE